MLSSRRTLTLLVVLCLGHVLLISAQVPGQRIVGADGAAFGTASRFPADEAGLSDGIGGLWSHYCPIASPRENEACAPGARSKARCRGARAGGKVRELEEALALQRTVSAPTLAARVIAGNPCRG